MMFLAKADPALWERVLAPIGGWKVVSPYAGALLILVGGYLLARLVRAAIKRTERPATASHTLIIAEKFSFYVIIILSCVFALGRVGVELSNLLAAAGILTVAISFAAQTSVSNVISGIFLLFDRPFSIGDTIKVDTTVGVVQGIGLLSSKVRTFENLVVRIPNEALLKSTITNYSLVQVRRVEISVTISQEADIEQVGELLMEMLRAHEGTLTEPEPVVLTDLTTETGVILLSRAWVLRTEYVQRRSDLTAAILTLLREHKIPRPRTYWASASPMVMTQPGEEDLS